MGLKSYKETKAHLQKAERESYWNFINNIIEIGDPDQEDRLPKTEKILVIHQITEERHKWDSSA